MESRSLPRLLGAIVTGTFTLAMVMGSVFLAQVDATLMVQRPTRVAQQLPTTTLYPTLAPVTPGAPGTPQAPTHSPTPEPPPTPCIYPPGWLAYEVQPGETLAQFVEVAGSSITALMTANCLDSAELYPGDIIYLPPVAFVTPTPVAVYHCGPPPSWRFLYYVRRGDTLYSLATRHGTSVEAIIQANCLVTDQIYVGQALYLPPGIVAPPTFTHPPTLTPTFFPTLTPTPEITDTPTPEVTDTPTPSLTPTIEPTTPVTPPPTDTPAPPPTETPTDTPVPTPTATPVVEIPTPTETPVLQPPPTEPPAPSPTATPAG